jgi:hypothetical protein
MEKERQELIKRQVTEREQLQKKYAEERRQMLQSGTDHWVPLLLQSSRKGCASKDFVGKIESLDVKRRGAGEALREHGAFVAVLQSALAKEAAQFLKKAQAQAEAAAGDPENAKELADDLDTKVPACRSWVRGKGRPSPTQLHLHPIPARLQVLMEQILLKMKNLREENSKNPVMRQAVITHLDELGVAADAELEATNELMSAARKARPAILSACLGRDGG